MCAKEHREKVKVERKFQPYAGKGMDRNMKVITGGVTAAKGFEAAGVEAAIKYKNRKDMALIYSQKPCVLAGTFTSNVVKAAPVCGIKRW